MAGFGNATTAAGIKAAMRPIEMRLGMFAKKTIRRVGKDMRGLPFELGDKQSKGVRTGGVGKSQKVGKVFLLLLFACRSSQRGYKWLQVVKMVVELGS